MAEKSSRHRANWTRRKRFRSLLSNGVDSTALALADINGDGRIDIVVADQSGPNRVMLNSGFAQFGAPRLFGSVDVARDVIVQDFNSDGRNDIFIVNQGMQNELWTSSGNLTLTRSFRDDFTDESVAAVSGDFDGDGDLDLFVANHGGQPHRIWLNDGSGQFLLSQTLNGGTHATATGVIDWDWDGDLDVLVVADDAQHELWINDGDGSFEQNTTVSLPAVPAIDVEILDATADGTYDLLLRGTRGAALAYSDGQGSYDRFVLFDTGATTVGPIGIGDFNRDGDWDVLIAGQQLHVFENMRAVLGDYNFDGTVDAADYTVWKDSFGEHQNLSADGNQNGVVDSADYTIWKDHFGTQPTVLQSLNATSLSATSLPRVTSKRRINATPGSTASSLRASLVDEALIELCQTQALRQGLTKRGRLIFFGQ
ncbi:MAG: FG-GAP-like repeat-containing protein [Pirellulaceae bacterium]|nr:VCBS repeat-containing protein [Planctomycetales bacterium]